MIMNHDDYEFCGNLHGSLPYLNERSTNSGLSPCVCNIIMYCFKFELNQVRIRLDKA